MKFKIESKLHMEEYDPWISTEYLIELLHMRIQSMLDRLHNDLPALRETTRKAHFRSHQMHNEKALRDAGLGRVN